MRNPWGANHQKNEGKGAPPARRASQGGAACDALAALVWPFHSKDNARHTILCHTIPYHTILYYTILYHTIPNHNMPYLGLSAPRIMHAIPYHTILCNIVLYHTITYHTIRFLTKPYHTKPYLFWPYHPKENARPPKKRLDSHFCPLGLSPKGLTHASCQIF